MTVIPRGENGSAAPRTPLWPPLAARGCSKARWSRSAASLASEAAVGEKTLRRHSANVTQARRCLHNILHGRRSAACTDQPSPLPQCHSGASAAWARARWTARRRPCAALPPMTFFLWLGGACQPAGARAPARSPGWQSADRHLQRCDRQHPVRGGCGLRGQRARGTAASWCAAPAPFARAPQEPAMIDHTSLRAF